MYVICFYWQGDRWQEHGYKPEQGHINHLQEFLKKVGQIDSYLPARYVNNLYYGVRRFADRKIDGFICYTNAKLDLDEGIIVRPFPMVSNVGVLPRVYMFSKDAGLFGHQVLCLDIDIVIVNSLGRILDYKGLFASRSDDFLGKHRTPGGDIMSFAAGEEAERVFWKPFMKDVKAAEEYARGRERWWITKCIGNRSWTLFDDWAPGAIVSFKNNKVRITGEVPKDASIVSFHGIPRTHEVLQKSYNFSTYQQWLKNYWA